jgi:hypothetical protein
MDKHNVSPSIDKNVRRRRVDLEGIRHPSVFVIGSGENKHAGAGFHKRFDIRSRISKAD